MTAKQLLRVLVAADFVLMVLGVVSGFLGESYLPEPLRAYAQAQRNGEMTGGDWMVIGIGIPLVIAALVASVGLFFLWRPARPLYAVLLAVAVILLPLLGPQVSPGWVEAILVASSMVSGGLVALLYCSPLKELFEKPKDAAG